MRMMANITLPLYVKCDLHDHVHNTFRECSFEKCWGGAQNGGQASTEFMWPPKSNAEFTWPPPPDRQNRNTSSVVVYGSFKDVAQMWFILNTHNIYHVTQSLIMHELWLIITHVSHYHELQRNLHLPCLAHKARGVWDNLFKIYPL